MRNTLETKLGIFFALAIIVIVVLMELVGSLDYFRKGTHVMANFDSVKELRVGDPVRLAGVNIGRVESIQLVTNKVQVRLKLENVTAVRSDSIATVRFAGLMGQNYIALTFGSPQGTAVAEDSILPVDEQPDLASVMAKLDRVASGVENLTSSFTGDEIQNLLGPVTDFLKENTANLTAIIGNMKTVSGQVAAGDGTIGQMIMDDSLYRSALSAVAGLNDASTNIQSTLGEAQQLVAGLSQGEGTLGRLVKDEALYNETEVAMSNLRELIEKMNLGQGTIGQLVNDKAFYDNVKLSLQKLDKAAESLEDQGPVSILGIAIGTLF